MNARLLGAVLTLGLLAAGFAPRTAAAAPDSIDAAGRHWYLSKLVTRLNSYTSGTYKYVWFTDNTIVQERCKNSNGDLVTVGYDEAAPGGRSTTALLMAAFLSGKRVTVAIAPNGCTIDEIYLEN